MLISWKYKSLALLDDCLVVFGRKSVGRQIEGSLHCRKELEQSENVGALLRKLSVPRMPSDLTFQIRKRIGQERRRNQQVTWHWRLGNLLAPFAVPAMAGLFCALMIFGAFIRTFEIPVHADSEDVPLSLRTTPRLLYSGPLQFDTGIQCMMVKILIDQNGRVADFQIIKGKQSPEEIRNLQYLLLFTVFDPATVFGIPTTETVFLHLRDGRLKGYSL